MSRRMIGIVLLLAGSEILGVLTGQCFYRLFLKTVPPIGLSSFNASTAHVAFIFYGIVAGLGIFVWALTAVALARVFRGENSAADASV